jgi:hypothetical protein
MADVGGGCDDDMCEVSDHSSQPFIGKSSMKECYVPKLSRQIVKFN